MDLRTGFAYWPLRNGIPASYPSLDRDETADVAVIGAGVTGALKNLWKSVVKALPDEWSAAALVARGLLPPCR